MQERIPAGDQHERLIQSHQPQLRSYIFVICPNHSAIEDILQETNRVLWQKREEFEMGTNFLAWARKVAQYQTMNFLKKRKAKSWLSFDSDLVRTLAEITEQRESFKQFRVESLLSCIGMLAQQDQQLIEMRYQKQMSLGEISEKTGRSTGGLKQAFLRIRRALRECIDRKSVVDE